MAVPAFRMRRGPLTRLASSALLLLMAACASPSGGGHARAGAPATVVAHVRRRCRYVIRLASGLMPAPFGTLLKDSPIPLHEVLLFHDETHAAAEADSNKDCYAIDGAPPRFVGRTPGEYLLCFDHDKLSRVEASVGLTAEEAPGVFARACALWLKSAAPNAGTVCEGRDSAVAFSSRLAPISGEATVHCR